MGGGYARYHHCDCEGAQHTVQSAHKHDILHSCLLPVAQVECHCDPPDLRIEICTARSGKSMKKPTTLPPFKTEADERKFWETHDSTDYIDWSKAERVRFPNLKPSTTAISIRLPLGLLEQIKIAANKRDVPYQSLIKMWLAEKVG